MHPHIMIKIEFYYNECVDKNQIILDNKKPPEGGLVFGSC